MRALFADLHVRLAEMEGRLQWQTSHVDSRQREVMSHLGKKSGSQPSRTSPRLSPPVPESAGRKEDPPSPSYLKDSANEEIINCSPCSDITLEIAEENASQPSVQKPSGPVVKLTSDLLFEPELPDEPLPMVDPARISTGSEALSQKSSTKTNSRRSNFNQKLLLANANSGSPTLEDLVRIRATKREQGTLARGASRGTLGDIAKSLYGERLLFGDIGIKRQDLAEDLYDVSVFYKPTGIWQAVARSEWFSNLTLLVICANTVYIGIDADRNDAEVITDAHILFQIFENSFCVFFTAEWSIRFFAFRYKRDCIKDTWFKFDTALVVLMITETWILPFTLGSAGTGIPTGMVKMFRLLRLFRMARLMRAFPELVAMIKGVRVAAKAVLSALFLAVMLIYIFGVIMFITVQNAESRRVKKWFGRLYTSMWTLLIHGTFMDSPHYIFNDLVDNDEILACILMVLFIMASALTVMNMLIGVLCEVVTQVAETEKEDNAVKLVKENLLVIIRELDEDGSGSISKRELQLMLDHEAALKCLDDLGVDLGYFMEIMDMFYSETEDIQTHRIIDVILMLRANRAPTIKDIVHGQKYTRWKIKTSLQGIEEHLGELVKHDA
jgi:hypothetical protein